MDAHKGQMKREKHHLGNQSARLDWDCLQRSMLLCVTSSDISSVSLAATQTEWVLISGGPVD